MRATNSFLFSCAVLVLSTHGVSAADLKTQAGSPNYIWSGFYIGANVEGAWSPVTLTDSTAGSVWHPDGTGFIAGVETGYNFQSNNLLYGVEGDFDGTTFRGVSAPKSSPLGLVQGADKKAWLSTLAARFGVTLDRWLFFAKVGGGWAQNSYALNGSSWSATQTSNAWLVGTGIEYAFATNWTAKLEYDYLGKIGSNVISAPVTISSHRSEMLKVGVNYQFGNRTSDSEASEPSNGPAVSTEALAKKSQNPVANLISLPFQNNNNFNTGPFNRPQDILNIQPVVPMAFNSDWNVISRTIVPVLFNQPDPLSGSSTAGIGDITQSLFISPANPGPIIWGLGPVFTLPSASGVILGTGKVLLGPTAVALVTPGNWVIGVLANNQWSVAGDSNRASVNTFLAQPFVNYNMPGGWFLSYSPIITANWNAIPGQQWTVPVGGGFGRVFKVGGQAINASLQAYYNVVRPDYVGNVNLRLSIALLFPK